MVKSKTSIHVKILSNGVVGSKINPTLMSL
jgi:hypothetical protein